MGGFGPFVGEPGQDCLGHEFGAVVEANVAWGAVGANQLGQCLDDPSGANTAGTSMASASCVNSSMTVRQRMTRPSAQVS